VQLRSSDDEAVGVVFRYQDPDHTYRFSMDRERGYRRLVRIVGGVHTTLAEDDFVYVTDQDYEIVVEAVGASLRVYQGDELVFDVVDNTFPTGSIGLYCWASEGVEFRDVRVDDFRSTAPSVYRFRFTTCWYANFFHQIHSWADEVWSLDAGDPAPLTPLLAPAVEVGGPAAWPEDAESRGFEALLQASSALSESMRAAIERLEITRVGTTDGTFGFLLHGPEPVDWNRTTLQVLEGPASSWATPPPATKLTDLGFSDGSPEEESATVLLRERGTLSRHRIQYRAFAGPIDRSLGACLLEDHFDESAGRLLVERFGPNAIDAYEIVDEGFGSSSWSSTEGAIVQSSNHYGGPWLPSAPERPGTTALIGLEAWTDVRIRVTLVPGDDDEIGVVFRYRDADNYYRFSMNRQFGYRRLVVRAAGVTSVLWEEPFVFEMSREYDLELAVFGPRILVYLDETLLLHVIDGLHLSGRIGLYCWAHQNARFERLLVESIERDPAVWTPDADVLDELDVRDAVGANAAPSSWSVQAGAIVQSSAIHVPGDPASDGTYAVGGPILEDGEFSVRIRSDDDEGIGVLFRYQDDDNYYRFSMRAATPYRRLIKKVGGVVTVLAEDAVAYTVGQSYALTVRTVGDGLAVHLDGEIVFDVVDGDLSQGMYALYCWANTGVRFERLVAVDRTRWVSSWRIHDEGSSGGPSVWEVRRGALVQSSNLWGGSTAAGDPDKPGTHVVGGEPTWTDYRLKTTVRSDDDDAIGVIFRYSDEDNFYRFSLDAERNYRRLVKKAAGVYTTLFEETGGHTPGRAATITVDVFGERIVGTVDGVRRFDLIDATHAAGKVGLYSWGNEGARFESLTVCPVPVEARALLRDRFADGDVSDWTVVDAGTISAPSSWSVEGGQLLQTSNIHSPIPASRTDPNKFGTYALAGDPTWTDYIFMARVVSNDDDAVGVLFRYQDADNYYRFTMDRQREHRQLVRRAGGVFTVLWQDGFAYQIGRSYEITVAADGDELTGWIDRLPVFRVEDSGLAQGRVGLVTWANQDAAFRQVRVYGMGERLAPTFMEDFGPGAEERWSFVDQGDQQLPSNWFFQAGELRQDANIHGDDPMRPMALPGTLALAAGTDFEDQRLTVGLRTEGDDDAIGVVFRYQDEQNYYRFSMDSSRNYRRLVKRAGGWTTLWEDTSQGYELARDYLVTVEAVGDRIRVYLDGVLLADVRDDEHDSGAIGLYCWANRGARFQRVEVTEPQWLTWKRFEREDPLPAGTRIRIFSGSEAAATPSSAGAVDRFVTEAGESGEVHFAREAVDLRLLDEHGLVVHGRRFLPPEDFTERGGRLLRNADGTACLLVPAPGDSFGRAIHRLRFTYRRDAGPGLPRLSQGGDSADEVVTLDIPPEPA
jgi:hypothetical protein